MSSDAMLYRGDCLEVLPTLDLKVDLVLADPPYGITARNAWDKIIPFEPLWGGLHAVARANTPIVLFAQMPFGAELIMSNRREYRYEWIWNKKNAAGFLNANRMPLRLHENILVFYGKLPTYNPQKWKGEPYLAKSGIKTSRNYGSFSGEWHTANETGERMPVDIIAFPRQQGSGNHPTAKPVALLEYLIKTYTNPGDTVLDFCMGSGSTGVAALNTGRKFIGIEKDYHWFNVAAERIGEINDNEIDFF